MSAAPGDILRRWGRGISAGLLAVPFGQFKKLVGELTAVHAAAPGAESALDAVRAASDCLGRLILAGQAELPSTPVKSVGPLHVPVLDLLLMLALDPRESKPTGFVRENKEVAPLSELLAPGSAIFRRSDPQAAIRSPTLAWSVS